MKKLTICVTTHCIKTETRGIYKGMNNVCPSAPSTKMIETVLTDFFNKVNIKKDDCYVHIGFDKRKNRNIDNQYEFNLRELLKNYDGKLIVNESEIDDPIETAPINFSNVINSVETEFYFLLEHDWVFTKQVPLKEIMEEMKNNDNINLIKFAQQNTSLDSATHGEINIDNSIILNYRISENIPILPCVHFSNNPYICKTKVFKESWTYMIFPTPEHGGFVEGPMNVYFRFFASKVGWLNVFKLFKCFVYGNPEETRYIHHLNGNIWR